MLLYARTTKLDAVRAIVFVMALSISCNRDPQPIDRAPSVQTAPPAASIAAAPTSRAIEPAAPADTFVEDALKASGHEERASWLERAEELRLQVLVSIVKPGAKTASDLEEHAFRVDAEYVYPASAIKTLLAVAALRYLDELAAANSVALPANVRMMRCDAPVGHCEVPKADEDKDPDDDEDSEKPSIAREIRKLLAWSDNDAYDRLYDLVGHERLNALMEELGLSSVRFHHRMSSSANPQKTRRVRVYPWRGKVILLPARESELVLAPTPAARTEVGRAHKTAKGLVEEPMSFADKNYASLRDLQRAHIALVRPELSSLDLKLSAEQRKVVVEAMSGRPVPGKAGAVHKPMLPGVLEILPVERIRYVNKSGRAYGFHLENAYVEDKESGGGFFVTAVVYANPNEVLNDDDYAYDALSHPLLAALGAGLSARVFAQ